VAQSTAVLVAIVGGFLVSRLVSLSSERGELLHRRAELAARLELSHAAFADVYAERLAVSRETFRDRQLEVFVDQRGNVDVEAVLSDFTPIGSSADEMRPYAVELTDQVRDAFRRITQAFDDDEIPSSDLDELRNRISGIPNDQANVYSKVGKFLADERRHDLGLLVNPLVHLSGIMGSSTIFWERQDTRISREAELRAQVSALVAEIQLIDEQADRFSRPQGVMAGIGVLAFFALMGVIYPMVVMATKPVPSDLSTRRLLVSAFIIGFITLLGYVVYYLRGVRLHEEPRSDETLNPEGGNAR
jgi:hypothetical protein